MPDTTEYTLPIGLIWGMGTNRVTGRLFIANAEGQRIDFDIEEAPHIAAALAEHCQDDDERSFVADQWGPTW